MADLVTSRIFVDGERGITAAKLNDIVASSVIQPAFYSAKPTASSLAGTDTLLALKSGAYVQAPFQTVIDSVGAALNSDAEIWNVRLHSFNAMGNPNFEVDQRNVGNVVAAANGFVIDRWTTSKIGTMVVSAQQVAATVPDVAFPGTNFRISRCFYRVTLTTQQTVLGASDVLHCLQIPEGSSFRELQTDVHSVSLLVRSSTTNLTFGIALRDPPTVGKSLTKLCTLGAANAWTLITLPNLPIWPSGNFSGAPGLMGYQFSIVLAAGTAVTSPANNTFQNGNFYGAIGQSNFCAQPVNSTFDIAFVQHEPGPVCSSFIDKPFSQNYDECLRYYQKTYSYGVVAGSINNLGRRTLIAPTAVAGAYGPVSFHKPMAKPPTGTLYNHATGTAGSVRDGGVIDHASAVFDSTLNETGFGGISFTTATTGAMPVYVHYTADTGW